MAWAVTWFVQSVALTALAAVLTRLPVFQSRPAARCVAWTAALAGVAVFAFAPVPGTPIDLTPASTPSGLSGDRPFPPPLAVPPMPAWMAVTGVAVWLAGVLAWGAHLLTALRRVRALKRACVPLELADARYIGRWQMLAGTGRSARLACCDDLDGPALLGFCDPVIALPRVHAERLRGEELDQVLLHELAHVRRRDDWMSLVEHAFVAVAWINPAVHWIRHQLSVAREMSCDDWVVRQTASPVAYARCLTAVAELRRHRGGTRLAAAATGARSALDRRVTRVLGDSYRPGSSLSVGLAALTPVVVGLLAVVVIHLPPVLITETRGETGLAPQGGADWVVGPSTGVRVEPLASPPLTTAVVGPPAARAARVPSGGPRTKAGLSTPVATRVASVTPARPVADLEKVGAIAGADGFAAPPLMASAIPGLAAPGVAIAGSTAVSESVRIDERPLWGRAAAGGVQTGNGARSAGRATAAMFKQLGSAVSRRFAR